MRVLTTQELVQISGAANSEHEGVIMPFVAMYAGIATISTVALFISDNSITVPLAMVVGFGVVPAIAFSGAFVGAACYLYGQDVWHAASSKF